MLEKVQYDDGTRLTSTAVGDYGLAPLTLGLMIPEQVSAVMDSLADLDNHRSGSVVDNEINDLPSQATGTTRQEVGDQSTS